MAVARSYLTAGVAFATAGLIAVTPALAPPLAPRDIQVAQATEAQVKLAADLKDLINVYFGVNPYNGVPGFDEVLPGTTGATGVLYQLLMEATGDATLVQDFFTGGAASVAARLAEAAVAGNPLAEQLIKIYYTGGATLLAQSLLGVIIPPDSTAGTLTNDFFDGGASQVAWRLLGGDPGTPAGTDPTKPAVPTTTPYLNIFFDIANPIPGSAIRPGFQGITGVSYQALMDATTDPGQRQFLTDFYGDGIDKVVQTQVSNATAGDANLNEAVNDFFDGGVTQVVQTQLLRAAGANTVQADLINEFFENGLSGVVRYLLVGPAPVDPDEGDDSLTSRVAANQTVDTADAAQTPEQAAGVQALQRLKVTSTNGTSKSDVVAVSATTAAKTPAKAEAPETGDSAKTPVVTEDVALETGGTTTPEDATTPEVKPAPEVVKPVTKPVVADTPAKPAASQADSASAPDAASSPEPAKKSTSKVKEKPAATSSDDDTTKSGNKFEPTIIIPGGGGSGGGGATGWGVFGDIANAVVKSVTGGGAPAGGGSDGGSSTGGGAGSGSKGSGSGGGSSANE